MRIQAPSSRAKLTVRLSAVDICFAASSPLLALYLRDAYILSHDGALTAGLYLLVSLTSSLIAFAAFGVHDGMSRYFSVRDAIAIAKAVLLGELMTCVVLFTFTRLEGIPRSTPVIHALILGVSLLFAKAGAVLAHRDWGLTERQGLNDQHVIIVGLNDLSSFYMNFLDLFGFGEIQAIALLDRDPRSMGRSINGVRVIGPPAHLQSIIEEFAVHGVHINRVVVGGETDVLSDEELRHIESVCARKKIELVFVPRLFDPNAKQLVRPQAQLPEDVAFTQPHEMPKYFRCKRYIDCFGALVMMVALSPLWILVVVLAFLDVGLPIFFWQQRVGLSGRNFLLYKIRTLRPPIDWRGHASQHEERSSWIGRLLRETRLDEFPQLLNVLVGDMSLIGPRPLLPHDQPPSPTVRLAVRPGITGWAQVNGAARLSPQEKDGLDQLYVCNASLLFDLQIAGLTFLCLCKSFHRPAQPAHERIV